MSQVWVCRNDRAGCLVIRLTIQPPAHMDMDQIPSRGRHPVVNNVDDLPQAMPRLRTCCKTLCWLRLLVMVQALVIKISPRSYQNVSRAPVDGRHDTIAMLSGQIRNGVSFVKCPDRPVSQSWITHLAQHSCQTGSEWVSQPVNGHKMSASSFPLRFHIAQEVHSTANSHR